MSESTEGRISTNDIAGIGDLSQNFKYFLKTCPDLLGMFFMQDLTVKLERNEGKIYIYTYNPDLCCNPKIKSVSGYIDFFP